MDKFILSSSGVALSDFDISSSISEPYYQIDNHYDKGNNSEKKEIAVTMNRVQDCTPSTSKNLEGSLEEKNEKMDDKQISDETVSSSNNQLGELETHCKSKQNENIWDKSIH
jgi:hypothetical protein